MLPPRDTSSTKTRHSLAGAITVAALTVLLTATASARAGTIAVAFCKAPSGVPAPTEGWQEGWTGSPFSDAGDSNECATGGPLVSYVGDSEAQPGSSGPYWQYTPPAGYKIVGGQVSAAFNVPGGGNNFTGAAGLLGPKFLFDQADVIAGPVGGTPASYEGTYPVAGHTGGSIWIYAFCEPPGDNCPVDDSNAWYWALADINSATIELEDASTPQASDFSGTLLDGTASGTAQLEFAASEASPGPGIYAVIVSVDGHALYDGTPNANAGKCVSLGRDASGIPEYLYAEPCPLIEQVDLPIDTTGLTDGRHELQVTVVDAAGVSATVYDGAITTANRTTVSSLLSSPLTATSTSEPTYAVVLNRYTAALGKNVRRSYEDSGLILSGQLRDTAGVPAPGVSISLVAQEGNQPTGALITLAHTITNTAGEWILRAPKGPSRELRILYGAVTAQHAQNAVAVKEIVRPSLELHVDSPGGGRIVFSGRLAISPMDLPRPLVTIETLAGREWEAVGHSIRVNANGTYSYVYHSSPLTLGRRFTFRAQTPETNLWQAGSSPTRKAVVH
jgi:hypothetical protein